MDINRYLSEDQTRESSFSTTEITKRTRDFLLEAITERSHHLHITIQPRYYDKWDDDELLRIIHQTDFLLSQRFLPTEFNKFCDVDRFQYVVNFHSPRNSKDRHCHLVLYIPFHMLKEKGKDGLRKKITSSRDEMKKMIGQAYKEEWKNAYPTDRLTMTRYVKSFTNKDGSVNSFRQLENKRLKEPYVQEIPDKMKDLTKVSSYDMKETFKPDRLEDMFFSEQNKKNKDVFSRRRFNGLSKAQLVTTGKKNI